MSLFTLNEYTEQKKFRDKKHIFTYKDGEDFNKNRDRLIVHNLGKTVGNREILRSHKKNARNINRYFGSDKGLGNKIISEYKKDQKNPEYDHEDHEFMKKNISSPKIVGAHYKNLYHKAVKSQPEQRSAAYVPISHKHFDANLIGLNKAQIHNVGDRTDKSMENSHNKRLLVHTLLSHEIDHKKGFEHEIAKHKGQKAREVQQRLRKSQSTPVDAMTNPKSFEVYKSLPAERSAYKVGLNTNSLRDRAFNDPKHVKEREGIFKKIEHDTRGKSIKQYHDSIGSDPHKYYEKYNQKIGNLLLNRK